MKKVLGLVLVICMVLAVPALAQENITKDTLFDEIELMAQENGLSVYRSGDNIAVQNGLNYLAISGDAVAYKKSGVLVKESIYIDGLNVKCPKEAIESVFGDKLVKNKEISPFILEEIEDKVIIKGLKMDVSEIVIPGEIDGKKVEIDVGAFEKSNVVSVRIEKGIETIPPNAFYNCQALVSVDIGDVKKNKSLCVL